MIENRLYCKKITDVISIITKNHPEIIFESSYNRLFYTSDVQKSSGCSRNHFLKTSEKRLLQTNKMRISGVYMYSNKERRLLFNHYWDHEKIKVTFDIHS